MRIRFNGAEITDVVAARIFRLQSEKMFEEYAANIFALIRKIIRETQVQDEIEAFQDYHQDPMNFLYFLVMLHDTLLDICEPDDLDKPANKVVSAEY